MLRSRGELRSRKARKTPCRRAFHRLAIEQAIAEELPRLEALDAERIGLEQELRGEQDNMTREFRALWSVQEGGGLRIIFGDQSPNEIALNLAYFDRLLNQRNEAIARFGELLARVQANTTALRASQAELARQSEALEQERRQAVSLQEDRQLALAAIEQSLDTDNARVAKLEADRRRLGELLDELQRSLAEMDTPLSYKPFPQARGEMVFPARGKP
ncbi:MAG: murein hydrolase activator EnvC family protein, partial [Luminiphilus sp.]